MVPSSDIGSSWRNNGYNSSSWNTGRSGFGYGDGDDATLLPNIISVFIRREFTITNLQDIQELVLSIDYDDGFVAYINGHEIARSNLGTAGTTVLYNQLTGSFSREATMYGGGFPENYVITNPGAILVNGVNVIAIQGHNTDPASTDLSLIPILTLGLSGSGYTESLPDYIQMPHKLLHTNFKLDGKGEALILSNPDSSEWNQYLGSSDGKHFLRKAARRRRYMVLILVYQHLALQIHQPVLNHIPVIQLSSLQEEDITREDYSFSCLPSLIQIQYIILLMDQNPRLATCGIHLLLIYRRIQ
ncbi:MAG: hypothetical protein IPJ37_14635 [Bacteroidales bacterium]|nr:hypothetical protein [Bacteroidales bacterium]